MFDKMYRVVIIIIEVKILAKVLDKMQDKSFEGAEEQPLDFNEESKTVASLKKQQLDSYDELESYKRLRKKRIKKSFIRMVVWLLVILFVPVFVFFSIVIMNPKVGHNFFGYSVYYVTSHSMVGVFDQYDCIITKSAKSLSDVDIGTDITFIRKSDGETVTHRVIDIIENEFGEKEFITKGVNNPTADLGSVSFDDILGIRIKTSASLGNIIEFFRTPYGIITFLGIFVFIIIVINVAFRLSDDIRAVGGK